MALRAIHLALALPLLLLLPGPAALAATGGPAQEVVVRTYEVAGVGTQRTETSALVDAGCVDAGCQVDLGTVCLTSDCTADVGGVRLDAARFPAGAVLRDVRVEDQVAPRVPAIACQDANGDGVCGGAGEPRVEFCDSWAHVRSDQAVPFQPGRAVTVFVLAQPVQVGLVTGGFGAEVLACPGGDLGSATRGTVAFHLDR